MPFADSKQMPFAFKQLAALLQFTEETKLRLLQLARWPFGQPLSAVKLVELANLPARKQWLAGCSAQAFSRTQFGFRQGRLHGMLHGQVNGSKPFSDWSADLIRLNC